MSRAIEEQLSQNLKLEEAIHFATNCHSGQVRKVSSIPFILHPMEVMQLLFNMGADSNLMIAGLLHDVVEDTDTGIEEIRESFGDDVVTLVAGHSEDKRRTWEERKQTEIDETRNADIRLKKLILADKLSNMRSLQRDYQAIGEKLWKRFNAGVEKQAWYYENMVNALVDMKEYKETVEYYEELRRIYSQIFV